MHNYQVDDPLDISEVHGGCGVWSVIARGLFDRKRGFFNTGNVSFLGIQLLGVAAFTVWALMMSFCFFKTLKSLERLRVGILFEIIGLDFIRSEMHNTLRPDVLEDEMKTYYLQMKNRRLYSNHK